MKHGGNLDEAIAQYGGAIDAWLDLSTGINPWPWPPPRDLADRIWQLLPSPAAEARLIDAARIAYSVPAAASAALAPGTQAVIQWLPRLAPAGAVAIIGPTYSEHVLAWTRAGREVVACIEIDELPEHVRHVVIVNPNNPDGRLANRAALARSATQLAERGGWLIVDEAFADLDPSCSAVQLCGELPVIVLRSFGKFYGLAGLRLGFAIAAPDIIATIAEALGPWAVSGPALAIGDAALRDQDWAAQTRERLHHQAGQLDKVLSDAGLAVVGGTGLFRLVRYPRAGERHAALARQQIWCRRFDWADDLLRFGLPDDAGLQRLAAALGAAV